MLPGVERLVRHLKAKGIPIAVATSGARGNFEIKTSKHRDGAAWLSEALLKRTELAQKREKLGKARFPTMLHRPEIYK